MDLIDLARQIYREAAQEEFNASNALAGIAPDDSPEEIPLGSLEAVRAAMSQFIKNFRAGKHDPQNQQTISALLQRVLAVDMDDKLNRRGDLPKALGLVHRLHRDYEERVLALTVVRLIDELWVKVALEEQQKREKPEGKQEESFNKAVGLTRYALHDAQIVDELIDSKQIEALYEWGSKL